MTTIITIEDYRTSIDTLKKWSDAYYCGKPLVSDATFDQLYTRVKEFEDASPTLIAKDSPTQTVNDIKPESKEGYIQAKHHVPMLSLRTEVDTSRAPLEAFYERVLEGVVRTGDAFSISPKYDGLGIDLQYTAEQGLVRAVTRGDGMEGEDVTHIIKMLPESKVPKYLYGLKLGKGLDAVIPAKGAPITGDVRAEIVVRKSDFERLNKMRERYGDEVFSNTRNAAAGLMRRLEFSDYHNLLTVYAYDIAWGDGEGYEQVAKGEFTKMMALKESGFECEFKIVKFDQATGDATLSCKSGMFTKNKSTEYKVTPEDEEGAISNPQEAKEKILHYLFGTYRYLEDFRAPIDFDIDGVVYKVCSTELREELGFSGREPRWAYAHKFRPEQKKTILTDLITQVGKTGRVTPVAILEPVFVGGVWVTNASIHNQDRLEELGIAPGDEVYVHRAGDVVPELVGVAKKLNDHPYDYASLFSSCPECGCALERKGAFWMCVNTGGCEGMLQSRLEAAVSRARLDIEDLGPKTIAVLIGNKDLTCVADIFKLTKEKLSYAGVADSLVINILDHIDKAKALPLERVLASIGIPNLGVRTAKDLLKVFSTIEAVSKITRETIASVPGYEKVFGEKIATGIAAAAREFEELLEVKSNWQTTQVVANGFTACISGGLDNMRKEDIKAKLEAAGFHVVGSVGKKLDVLISNLPDSSKTVRAMELKVPIISDALGLEALLHDPAMAIAALKNPTIQ